MLDELEADVIASGANLDDMGDYRPGLRAASEHGVRHPCRNVDLPKRTYVRLRLPGSSHVDKPATPCLSSRIAYGEEATPGESHDRPSRAVAAPARVSHLARALSQRGSGSIEVPLDDLPRFVELEFRGELLPAFCALGFKFVTFDLEGFRSGSLNSVIPAEDLLRSVGRANSPIVRG